MLESLGSSALPADPDPGTRPGLHFARSVGTTLYTIRKDDTLWAWRVGDDLVPTRCASTKTITIGSKKTIHSVFHFYEPTHHVYDGHLVLQNETSLAIIDIRDPERPEHRFAQDVDGLNGCVAADGHLYVQLYETGGSYSYGRAPFPKASTEELAIGDRSSPDPDGSGAVCALAREGTLYWVTQDGLHVRTVTPNAAVASMKLDTVTGYPLVVDQNRIAILEIYDDERNGVVFVDLAGKKPKRLVSLLKKQVIRSWVLVGNELFVVARKGGRKKSVSSLCIVDVSKMEEVWSARLPIAEDDEPSQIYWLGIAGDRAAVLQGNGQLHQFRIKR